MTKPPTILMDKKLWDDIVEDSEYRRQRAAQRPQEKAVHHQGRRFKVDRKSGLLVPTQEGEQVDAVELAAMQTAHDNGWISHETMSHFIGVDYAVEEDRYKQEILGEFLPDDEDIINMATSKSRRKLKEMDKERKRRSFEHQAHHVTRGKVKYSHLRSTIGDTFVDPAKVIIYSHDGACGYCPLSLVCLSNRSWSHVMAQFTFFKCKRCAALGFVSNMTGAQPFELHVCMLMRFGKQGGHWANDARQRNDGLRAVETNFVARAAWDSYDVQQRFREWGDIPFGCITRCRDNLGYETMKKLPDEVDCRTTLQNAVNNVKTY
jgi:hypothetical protein